ncbi:MAG TPA: TauD/TfdA family dioxygenase [Actinocrinis sp.]|nr:TauD/TfdA family dioxygenase [Actinocrinis sp.]
MADTLVAQRGATVWTAGSVTEADWSVPLTGPWLDGLEAVRTRLAAAGVTVDRATPEQFRGPELAGLAEGVRAALDRGPGFAILRGWPVARWGDADSVLMYWGLGTLLGDPLAQNSHGDRVYLVTDTTSWTGNGGRDTPTGPRGSTTNVELSMHTDSAGAHAADRTGILGLLCLRAGASGGESLLTSGHTVHNRLLARDSALAASLYRQVHFGRGPGRYQDGGGTDVGAVFDAPGDRLKVRYNRGWIRRGHEAVNEPLPPETIAALDAFDELAGDDALMLRVRLEPGDVLLLDNTVVLHGRTAFVDNDDPAARRCLVRLWLRSRT